MLTSRDCRIDASLSCCHTRRTMAARPHLQRSRRRRSPRDKIRCVATFALSHYLSGTSVDSFPTTVTSTAIARGWRTGCNGVLPSCRPLRCARPRPTSARMAEGLARGKRKVMIAIGGGAAGYFGAIRAASIKAGDHGEVLDVIVLEAGKRPLQKVKVSGGGRCNVMHDASKAVSLIAQGYPRGRKQLIGPFNSLFGPSDAAAWFRARGVGLKTEGDGRMFPATDDSQTIIDCLEDAARAAGVLVVTSARVSSVSRLVSCVGGDSGVDQRLLGTEPNPRFALTLTTAKPLSPDVRDVLRAADSAAEEMATTQIGGHRAVESNTLANTKCSYHVECDFVLQATGSAREGHAWVKDLGHAVSPPVPSLFTLTVKDSRLQGLAGLSVRDAELRLVTQRDHKAAPLPPGLAANGARVKASENVALEHEHLAGDEQNPPMVDKMKRKKKKKGRGILQRGPLLVTHTGLSGPAALRLSAFAARELHESGYKGKLVVNWLAGTNPSKMLEDLTKIKDRLSKKAVHAFCPFGADGGGRGGAEASLMPKRLWQRLADAAGIATADRWADVSKAKLWALAQQLAACELGVVGKGAFKEEFVTCGGVSLSALDMRTMESRNVPGLFFAGEVVDIDGVTGGFNFQSAWTTGWVAGSAIARRAAEEAISALQSADREGGHSDPADFVGMSSARRL